MGMHCTKLGLICVALVAATIVGCGGGSKSNSASDPLSSAYLGDMKVARIGESESYYEYLYEDVVPSEILFQDEEVSWGNDSRVSLKQGEYFLISAEFTAEVSGSGAAIELILSEKGIEGSQQNTAEDTLIELQSWSLGGGTIESFEAGDMYLDMPAFIPSDIAAGSYVLMARLVLDEEDVDQDQDINSSDKISTLPVAIEENLRAKRIDIGDVTIDSDYYEFPYPGSFSSGYSSDPIAEIELELFNTSGQVADATITAVIEFSGGERFAMGMFDTKSGTVAMSQTASVEPGESGEYLNLTLYSPEEGYQNFVDSLPDPSFEGEEPLNAKVVLNVVSASEGVKSPMPESLEAEVLLTAYEAYEDYFAGDTDFDANSAPAVLPAYAALSVSEVASSAGKKAKDDLKEDGRVFNFTFDEWKPTIGREDRIAIGFEPEFAAEGYWDLPRFQLGGESAIKLHVFGAENDVARVEARGVASLKKMTAKSKKTSIKRQAGWIASVSIFGSKIYERNSMEEGTASEQMAANATKEQKEQEIENGKTDKPKDPYNKSWEEEKVLASQRFFAGPVPLNVEGGLKGEAKYAIGVGVKDIGVELAVEANASGDAFVRGGVDAVAVRAGVTGELNAFNVELKNSATGGLKINDAGKFALEVGNELEVLPQFIKGQMGLYGGVRTVKICRKGWGGWFRYPCGFDWSDYKFWFYSTPWMYEKKDWKPIEVSETLYTF